MSVPVHRMSDEELLRELVRREMSVGSGSCWFVVKGYLLCNPDLWIDRDGMEWRLCLKGGYELYVRFYVRLKKEWREKGPVGCFSEYVQGLIVKGGVYDVETMLKDFFREDVMILGLVRAD